MMHEQLLRMEHIRKVFPGVTALDDISLTINAGEIHGIVGENGAGKSTLIKILTGVFEPTEGKIFVQNVEKQIKNPIVAKNLGIGAVYQDVTVARHLSVAENFYLGRLPKNKFGFVDWKLMYHQTQQVLQELHIPIDPKTILKNLSVSQQEMILIAKKYFENEKVMIFDEPTALLSNEETQELFRIIRRIKAEGGGIIYISHRLEEIFELCDVVTVIRDGKRTAHMSIDETNPDDLISKMVGRNIENMYLINHPQLGEEVLRTEGLSAQGAFEDIDISVRSGEILGLFGLVGSGTTDIMRSIFGAKKSDKGTVYLRGKSVAVNSPRKAIEQGLGYLPEDRKDEGLGMKLSVHDNINMSSLKELTTGLFIQDRIARKNTEKQIKELRIRTPGARQIVSHLSGGNQQKVVLGKWLTKNSKIFIFNEPTAGIDVGAKSEIYAILEKLINEGAAIIIVSSYLPEIMGLSDKITVIHEGKQIKTVTKQNFNEEMLVKLASGICD
jgi:ribose transport system ATP-binding protein